MRSGQIIPIYIPNYISSQTYAPARVLPRLFFYNGMVECETWYVADETNTGREVTRFPYFDNYNVVTGSFPTDGSKSLLFNNEAPVYGSMPTGSLYSTYWDSYVGLLYNPTTRLINCSAIIPLADYFKMELNDICEWRGNYYHLRAINNYNLSNGECQLQLLGPILPDILPDILPSIKCGFDFSIVLAPTTTTTTTTTSTTTTTTSTTSTTSTTTTTTTTAASGSATLYWSFSELTGGNGIYDLYINAVSVETRNSTANGTYTVYVGDVITVGCNADQCTGGGSTYTNIVVTGEITDAACQNNGSIPSYVSPGYTVVSGDVGTNLYVDLQVSCDGACI